MKTQGYKITKGRSQIGRFLVLCTVGIMILISAALAQETWTAIDDQADRGIDWRIKKGTFKFSGGKHQYDYSFRNRYSKKVRFRSVITYIDENGTQKTEKMDWVIPPQGTKNTWSIWKQFVSVAITKPVPED